MSWQSLKITVEAQQQEDLSDLLFERGAMSVTVTAADNSEIFEINGQVADGWTTVTLTALFAPDNDIDGLISQLKQRPKLQFTVGSVDDQNWAQAWLDHFHPVQITPALWVVPSWHQAVDENAINIQLDPGMSFGTGTHPSTQLCLSWLCDLDLRDKTMLDYGSGSGILAIAALKLGCSRATAVDIDPRSLAATRDNADKNQVSSQIQAQLPQDLAAIKFDIVVANILATTILDLKQVLLDHLDRNARLLLSGVLIEQQDSIITAFSELQWESRTKDNWVGLLGHYRH